MEPYDASVGAVRGVEIHADTPRGRSNVAKFVNELYKQPGSRRIIAYGAEAHISTRTPSG